MWNLTNTQKTFLDNGGAWALNSTGFRGEGRSVVMAYLACKMAIAGQTVHLYDPSLILSHGRQFEVHVQFKNTVQRVAQEFFPDYEFKYNNITNTMSFAGMRARVPTPAPLVTYTPMVQTPVTPVTPEIVDDGSEENT